MCHHAYWLHTYAQFISFPSQLNRAENEIIKIMFDYELVAPDRYFVFCFLLLLFILRSYMHKNWIHFLYECEFHSLFFFCGFFVAAGRTLQIALFWMIATLGNLLSRSVFRIRDAIDIRRIVERERERRDRWLSADPLSTSSKTCNWKVLFFSQYAYRFNWLPSMPRKCICRLCFIGILFIQ